VYAVPGHANHFNRLYIHSVSGVTIAESNEMKLFWKISVPVVCVVVLCVAAVIWQVHERKLMEAARVCRVSAEQGDAKAQYGLGTLYYDGKGVPKNYAEALRWYRKAAEQGNANGQNGVGYMYAFSQGVPLDRAEADRWYHKAAGQGNEYAQQALGLRGRGWSTFSIINYSIIPLGCLILLIGSLSLGWRLQNRQQRSTAFTGTLGLIYTGLSLYWLFGIFPSVSVVNAFYFGKSIVGGVFFVLLISIVLPERAKPMSAKITLGIFGILFLCLNLLFIVLIDTKRFIPARAFCSLNGLLIGLSIPLTIFLWRSHKQIREEPNLDSEDAAIEPPDESKSGSNLV
jgi:hypothetical protein